MRQKLFLEKQIISVVLCVEKWYICMRKNSYSTKRILQ